jgi:hypothetical protein
MKRITFIIVPFFILCTSALAAQWVMFSKEEGNQLYYDAGSVSCYRHFDRMSGGTTGYSATIWITTSKQNKPSKDDMVLWSLDCTARKIDKQGGEYPDIYGEHIKPDSVEEKLYKIICSNCRKKTY